MSACWGAGPSTPGMRVSGRKAGGRAGRTCRLTYGAGSGLPQSEGIQAWRGLGGGRRSIPSGRVWSPLQPTLWTATEAHSPVPPRARLAWVQPVTHQHWSGLQPSPTNTKILGKKELAMEKPLRDQAMKYQVLLWTATSGSSPGL